MDLFSAFSSHRHSAVQRIVQLFGAALSRVAPRHAANLAIWIWARPPGRKSRQNQVTGASLVSVELDGREASGFIWEASGVPRCTVLVQHGWGGSVAKMSSPIRALIESGATVVAFDSFCHGSSGPGRFGPRQTSLIEMSELIEVVNREFGPFTAVVAHSAGTTAVARALLRSFRVERAVFLAPLVDPMGQHNVLSKALGLSSKVAAAWPEMLLARFGTTRGEIEMLSSPAPHGWPATLLIQDQDDRLSPPEGARALSMAWSNCELLETKGLGHYRILNDPSVLAASMRFVSGELNRSPVPAAACTLSGGLAA